MSKRTTLILAAAVITAGALVLSASDAPNDTRPARVRPGRRGAGPKGPHRLTEQQEQKLLKVLADKRPEYHKRLLELRESNPRRYRLAMAGMWRWYQRLQRMPREEREAYLKMQEARIKALRLARAIRGEKDDQKIAKLKEQLREAAAEQFQAEQVRFEARLVRLEEHVKRLRADLKDRKQRRDQIIAERIERLLRDKPSPPEGRKHPRPRTSTKASARPGPT